MPTRALLLAPLLAVFFVGPASAQSLTEPVVVGQGDVPVLRAAPDGGPGLLFIRSFDGPGRVVTLERETLRPLGTAEVPGLRDAAPLERGARVALAVRGRMLSVRFGRSGSAFAPERVLSRTLDDEPVLVTGRGGDVAIAWAERGVVRLVTRRARGAFTPPATVGRGAPGTSVSAAVGPNGEVAVAWADAGELPVGPARAGRLRFGQVGARLVGPTRLLPGAVTRTQLAFGRDGSLNVLTGTTTVGDQRRGTRSESIALRRLPNLWAPVGRATLIDRATNRDSILLPGPDRSTTVAFSRSTAPVPGTSIPTAVTLDAVGRRTTRRLARGTRLLDAAQDGDGTLVFAVGEDVFPGPLRLAVAAPGQAFQLEPESGLRVGSVGIAFLSRLTVAASLPPESGGRVAEPDVALSERRVDVISGCGGSCGIVGREVFEPRLRIDPSRRAVLDVQLASDSDAERRVVVRLERRVGAGWRPVARARPRSVGQRVRVRFPAPLRSGTYRALVVDPPGLGRSTTRPQPVQATG